MSVWLFVAQVIAAREGPVEIGSLAASMPPRIVADTMLKPGHPPVDHVRVGSQGRVPLPPGFSPQLHVRLETTPEPGEPGFCQRTSIEMRIVNPGAAATVVLDSTAQHHRFGNDCVGGDARYGAYQSAVTRSVIRDFDRARRARRASYAVTFIDRLPADFTSERFASGEEAAKNLPLDRITLALDAARLGSIPDAVRRALPSGEGIDNVGFVAGNYTTGIITRERGRITRVWIKAEIPPPF